MGSLPTPSPQSQCQDEQQDPKSDRVRTNPECYRESPGTREDEQQDPENDRKDSDQRHQPFALNLLSEPDRRGDPAPKAGSGRMVDGADRSPFDRFRGLVVRLPGCRGSRGNTLDWCVRGRFWDPAVRLGIATAGLGSEDFPSHASRARTVTRVIREPGRLLLRISRNPRNERTSCLVCSLPSLGWSPTPDAADPRYRSYPEPADCD